MPTGKRKGGTRGPRWSGLASLSTEGRWRGDVISICSAWTPAASAPGRPHRPLSDSTVVLL